jgi:hypothetical protein
MVDYRERWCSPSKLLTVSTFFGPKTQRDGMEAHEHGRSYPDDPKLDDFFALQEDQEQIDDDVRA